MSLGENIYRYRTEKNMSQGDLADALDVSRQSVSKWENNSATPELEKLVKMSQLFHITLDELVSGPKIPQPPAPPPVTSGLSHIPTRKLVGFLLFVCAFLVFLVSAALGGAEMGSVMCIPFALCGVCCYAFERHTGVWCAWALYLPFAFIPLKQYVRLDISYLVTLFVQIPILIYTLLVFRKEPLTLNRRWKLLLALGYALWFLCVGVKIKEEFITTPQLWNGYDWAYILEVISFPLFTFLLSVTTRLLKKK